MWQKKFSLGDRYNYHHQKSYLHPEKNGYSFGFEVGADMENGIFPYDEKELNKFTSYKGFVQGVKAGMKAVKFSKNIKW